MYKPLLALAIAASALVSAPALPDTRSDQPGPAENAADVNITTHILQPRELPAAEVSALKVPAGFRVTRFARDLGNVRVLAVAPDGTVYATRRDEGDVIMFKDPIDPANHDDVVPTPPAPVAATPCRRERRRAS